MNSDNKLVLSEAEGLIPQYRFPEFKNDGNWDKLKVEEIIMNENGVNDIIGVDK